MAAVGGGDQLAVLFLTAMGIAADDIKRKKEMKSSAFLSLLEELLQDTRFHEHIRVHADSDTPAVKEFNLDPTRWTHGPVYYVCGGYYLTIDSKTCLAIKPLNSGLCAFPESPEFTEIFRSFLASLEKLHETYYTPKEATREQRMAWLRDLVVDVIADRRVTEFVDPRRERFLKVDFVKYKDIRDKAERIGFLEEVQVSSRITAGIKPQGWLEITMLPLPRPTYKTETGALNELFVDINSYWGLVIGVGIDHWRVETFPQFAVRDPDKICGAAKFFLEKSGQVEKVCYNPLGYPIYRLVDPKTLEIIQQIQSEFSYVHGHKNK
jgi:hypothetical protein